MFPYSIIYTVQYLKCIIYHFQSQGRCNFNLCNNFVLSLFLGEVQYCTLGMIIYFWNAVNLFETKTESKYVVLSWHGTVIVHKIKLWVSLWHYLWFIDIFWIFNCTWFISIKKNMKTRFIVWLWLLTVVFDIELYLQTGLMFKLNTTPLRYTNNIVQYWKWVVCPFKLPHKVKYKRTILP